MKNSSSILKALLTLAFAVFGAGMFAVATGVPVGVAITFGVLASLAIGSAVPNHAFASLITGTPITFNGKEAMDGIIEPAFQTPELNEFMTIVQDIVAKEQIAFLGRLTKVTKKDAGCGTGATDKTIPMSEKFWEPQAVKVWLTQCAADLESTFFVWGLSKGIKKYDLTTGDFVDFVMDILTTAVKEDVFRLVWFGDTAVDTIANGSFLNSAGDVPFYDAVDGFWKQIFAAVTATTMKRVTISVNANASFATQALGATDAYDTFKAMIEKADSRLKSEPNKIILCTMSMFDNWLSYKESKNIDSSFVRQDKGFKTDVYRGITIMAVDAWDRAIDSDMNNATKWITPHRALMTTKSNLLVGIDSAAAITDFKVFLDDVTEINHMKGGYKIDCKIVHEFMAIAAY